MSIVVAIATLSVLIGLATVYIYTRKMSAAEEQLKTAEAEGAAQPPEVPISGEAEALAAATIGTAMRRSGRSWATLHRCPPRTSCPGTTT